MPTPRVNPEDFKDAEFVKLYFQDAMDENAMSRKLQEDGAVINLLTVVKTLLDAQKKSEAKEDTSTREKIETLNKTRENEAKIKEATALERDRLEAQKQEANQKESEERTEESSSKKNSVNQQENNQQVSQVNQPNQPPSQEAKSGNDLKTDGSVAVNL
jgi:hypothetical protein